MTLEAQAPIKLAPDLANERLWSVDEACTWLGVTPTHFYQLAAKQEVRCARIGKRLRIPESELRAYVERRSIAAQSGPGPR